MCGIHGLLAFRNGARPDEGVHRRMGDITVHRGPDDHGFHLDGEVLLGMRRLSIIDVDGGHQPISNEDGTLWLVCNGEIYNFRELRRDLEQRGHRFATHSDSEVILHLYEEYGADCVSHLNGMFGFALWDAPRRRLVLGRDRLGIKPIYYVQDGSRLAFASEAKALFTLPGVRAGLDTSVLGEYLTLGYVSAPRSMLAGVRKLPPATLLTCENGECRLTRYWDATNSAMRDAPAAEWIDAVRTGIETSVRDQMVSDVPLGAFLSGGIDSSAVVAMMARHSDRPVKTYSIGFGDSGAGAYYNELPYAKRVAELFGTDHKEIVVAPDAAALLPKLIWHLDEPIADSAFVTTYLVSEFAQRDVTVILCGVGGDELFGGYRRYLGQYYDRYYARLPQWLRRGVLTPIARRLPSDRHSPLMNLSRYARSYMLADELNFAERYRAYVQVCEEDLAGDLLLQPGAGGTDALDAAFERYPDDDGLRRLMMVDMATQLPDDLLMLTDKMSMACSLECRVPLLDHELVELAASMPSDMKIRGRELKYVLKKAFADVLPKDILYRSKRGFGAPMGAWMKRELRPLLGTLLSRQSIESRGLFDFRCVARMIEMHETARADHTDHLLALMNLELWCRMYLDGLSPADVSGELSAEAVA